MFGAQDSKLTGLGVSSGKDQFVLFLGKIHSSHSASQQPEKVISSRS